MPADGTAAVAASKCRSAITYATVGDLLKTSTTRVRFDFSSILSPFANARATAPPTTGSNTEHATADFHNVDPRSDAAEFAAPPAQSIIMALIPSFAVGILFGKLGNTPLNAMPAQSGAKTSLAVDFRTATPSIGIDLPNRMPITRGVAATPNIVVDNVHTTDSETLPPANNANKFDACPPPTDPKMMVPAATCGLQPGSNCDIAIARRGITMKQHIILSKRTGLWSDNELRTSLGDVVKPMANISTDRDVETAGREPSVGPIVSGRSRPAVAARVVHKGAILAADLVLLSSLLSFDASFKPAATFSLNVPHRR